jgi:hypothetical protein
LARSLKLKRNALIAVVIASALVCAPNLNARQAAKGTESAAPVATPTVEEQLIAHLPPDWQLTALRYHVFSDYDAPVLKTLGGLIEGEVRLTALRRLVNSPGAEEFVLKHLEDELANLRSSGNQIPQTAMRDVLIGVIRGLADYPNWLDNPLALPFLEKEAATDPDPKISEAAVDALHVREVRRLLVSVDMRLANVSYDYKNHKQEVDRLEAEQQELLYEKDNIDIPLSMQTPPPVFNVPTKSSSIRVLMMGDFGTRGEDQHKVAAAMIQEHQKKPFDFGLTLGDNFYVPITSPDDPNFKFAFEDLYGPMGITFYPSFGNHDWGGEYPAIVLAYSAKNPHWNFPAPYYTYTAGSVQFFVVNTEFQFETPDGLSAGVSALQLRWLQSELEKSKATWKVVYGHVPIFTSLYVDTGPMQDLLEVLKGRADFYIAGHVHNLDQFKPVSGVNFFIIGSSGRGEVEVNEADPNTIFAREAYGFGVLEANGPDLTVRIIGEDDKEMHVATFHK